ncbi:ribbon-helix-helix protein, CopG family [Streptomyces virginiae]|uniref:ribbon-helix-helix protein, CopG family n=1 Tax=Streptomyces virginiae TaxID=1961 RepID=UPI0037A46CFB
MKKSVSYSLDEKMIKDLVSVAAAEDRPISSVVRAAVREYLARINRAGRPDVEGS